MLWSRFLHSYNQLHENFFKFSSGLGFAATNRAVINHRKCTHENFGNLRTGADDGNRSSGR